MNILLKVIQVIKSIDLNDLSVTIQTQDQAFAAPTTSHNTVAKYANPFGFSLQVVQAGQNIILGSHGVQIAQVSRFMPLSGILLIFF